MKKWITGEEVARRLGKEEFEIFDLLASGELQAHDHNGQKIKWLDFNRYNYPRWEHKWQDFLSCRFLETNIHAIEIADGKKTETSPPVTLEPQRGSSPPTDQTPTLSSATDSLSKGDPESFIRSLKVSFVSDTEIKIKCGNQRAKIFTQMELGFRKANSAIWKTFIQILTSPDHTYHVGKAHGAERARKESYDVSQKRLSGINNKLLSFFNIYYQVQLPNKFRVYELIPEKREAPGTYTFKFQIVDASQVAKKNYENLSQEEMMHEIEKLSSELDNLKDRGDKDSEEKMDEIKNILYPLIKIATKKEWLTKNRAWSYLNPSREYVSPLNQGHKRKKHPDLVDTFSEGEGSED